ncbi:MAG TPA: hypothetical protein VEF04_22730 [Blastocatellia bacterium]|nr:hypothetical protein [Blastocatellia bacterium]
MKLPRRQQQEIQTAINEWAEAKRAYEELLAEREAELKPIVDRYERKMAPIRESYAEQITPLMEKMDEKKRLVESLLLSNLNEDGSVGVMEIVSDGGKAQVHTTSQRTIEPSAFFELTPAPARDASFWNCLTVGIAKAEKFLGSRIDQIAKKKFFHKVELTLTPEEASE